MHVEQQLKWKLKKRNSSKNKLHEWMAAKRANEKKEMVF